MALHEVGLGFLKSLSLPHGAQVYKVNLGRALPTHRGLFLEKGILTLIPRVIIYNNPGDVPVKTMNRSKV